MVPDKHQGKAMICFRYLGVIVQSKYGITLVALAVLLPGTARAQFNIEKKLKGNDTQKSDNFGYAVGLDDDTAIVGAHWNGTSRGERTRGAAYIFQRDRGGTDNWGQFMILKALDKETHDAFGHSVAISGDIAIAGAIGDDDACPSDDFCRSGSAYIFDGTSAFDQVAKLTASDATQGDYFGWSTAVSGDTAIVGATRDGGGSAYIFQQNNGGTNNWGEVAKLIASDVAIGDRFGTSLSISGDTAIVGAFRNDDVGSNSGSAYIFERNNGGANNWGQVAKLTASDATSQDDFGMAVSLSGNIAIVGARGNDDNGTRSGSAYIFERNNGGTSNWGEVAILTASDAAEWDEFGHTVSISGERAIVGAIGNDDGGTHAGAAYIFTQNQGGANNWGELKKLTFSNGNIHQRFGESVSISGETALVGQSTTKLALLYTSSGSSLVPEPSTLVLMVLGGLGLVTYRRRQC